MVARAAPRHLAGQEALRSWGPLLLLLPVAARADRPVGLLAGCPEAVAVGCREAAVWVWGWVWVVPLVVEAAE
ncbi:MAG: hypothetical protein HPY69_20465 [Armatimonadetes bacterium]|nr:hypothetical protein [Armatimonadota bacterium]